MDNSIFISRDKTKSLNGKLTFTNVFETIPDGSVEKPSEEDWKSQGKTEWRWRFLQIGGKSTVEISCLKPDSNKRLYFNNKGEWVNREVDPVFDQFVTKERFYYSDI